MKNLRIAAAQINTTVGDINGNVDLISKYIEKSQEYGVNIVAFPELSITGYPPEDLLLNDEYINANIQGLEKIKNKFNNILSLIGFVEKDDQNNKIYNSVAGLFNGKINFKYQKFFLPNYGVFDEKRYFSSGKINEEIHLLDYMGIKIGVNICEDLWEKGPPDIIKTQTQNGAELIININSSPFEIGKNEKRIELLTSKSKENKCFSLYVNQIGGQDELVFDGGSMLSSPNGDIIANSKQFEENLLILDINIEEARQLRRKNNTQKKEDHSNNKVVSWKIELPNQESYNQKKIGIIPSKNILKTEKIETIYKALLLGTRDYVHKSGFEKVLIAISGGIDSALVTVIANDSIGNKNVIGVNMPSRYSSESSISDSEILCRRLGVNLLNLPIEPAHISFEKILQRTFENTNKNVAEENIQSRIRGTIIMALANKFNYLVMVTGNKSEMATGYATLYGDMAGAFAIIKDIPKSMVYELSKYRNLIGPGSPIPETILQKEPSAELKPNQLDSDSLPPYDQLDRIIEYYVEKKMGTNLILEKEKTELNGASKETIEKITRSIDKNEYKRRQSPPGIKITSTSFGKDRRMPIASKWNR